MVRAGEYMDPDLNTYDPFMRHAAPELCPRRVACHVSESMASFYSFDYMRRILANAHPENYWNILRNFIWYKIPCKSKAAIR